MARRSIRLVMIAAAGIVLLGALLGIMASRRAAQGPASDPERAADTKLVYGEGHEAEEAYWRLLQAEPPTVGRIVGLLDAHVLARTPHVKHPIFERNRDDEDDKLQKRTLANDVVQDPFLSEEQIDTFLSSARVPHDIAQLGRYWRDVLDDVADPDLEKWVTDAADRNPPLADANRLLGNAAERGGDDEQAAARYLREGRLVPHAGYTRRALLMYEDLHEWALLNEALQDPEVAAHASSELKARLAAERNDWRQLLKWSVISSYERPAAAPLVLTAIAALAWALFCAQLGRARERPFFRPFMYLLAFMLGVASIPVTDLAVILEESKLHLVVTGDPVRDVLYFVFGVGFREELSKLLLFVPLLPILRRYGTKLDVVVCGAFVGLGFAAMENLGYLAAGDMSTSLGRFLSANFLHMAMTSILASALDDFLEKGDEHAPELSRTVLLVMALHGLYDFFISHPKIGGGYLSMMAFFILANRFLATVETTRGRSERNDRLFGTFVLGIAVVVATSFVWASILVGPTEAALALSSGLLGDAILIVVFARRFREI